ncbi:phosphotransferase [Streptomyces hydrogenans]
MTTVADDPRIRLARDLLGTIEIVPDTRLPRRVVRVSDAGGRHFIVKQHTSHERYMRELHAYRNWGIHMDGHIPELIGCRDDAHALLLTALAGDPAETVALNSPEEESAQYEAGRVLGLLHRATSVPRSVTLGTMLAGRLRTWIAQALHTDLISPAERNLLGRHAVILSNSRMDSAVCHLDYQPRNWLVGTVFGVCDFEHMRRDALVRDFARLEFRCWQTAPHLRMAFLEGYGRPLDATELRLLESFGAIEAATALVKGHKEGDPTLSAHGRTTLSRLS